MTELERAGGAGGPPGGILERSLFAKGGVELRVGTDMRGARAALSLKLNSAKRCILHWGLAARPSGPWRRPSRSLWPEGTRAFGQAAVQTPFPQAGDGIRIIIPREESSGPLFLVFALFFPDEERWDNNGGRNYHIALPVLPGPGRSAAEALDEATSGEEILYRGLYELEGGGTLAVAVRRTGEGRGMILVTDRPGSWILHWGIHRGCSRPWVLPPPPMRGPETVVSDDSAVETPFACSEEGLARLEIHMPGDDLPQGVSFVLREKDTGRWLKDRGRDFTVPVDGGPDREGGPAEQGLAAVAEAIVSAETGRNSWTLMHRFDLCRDLLDRVRGDADGLALLAVWLRFSALRQLDWQRNFNTKPRELAHALNRLTGRLAETYAREPEARALVRLMFASLGRGGEGQRIRDEILEIMHRHHVKEVSGHFLEEWHQKLHNNTTPDDIVICEAYLEFLRSRGDQDVFYRTLREGGVSRERLEGYDRPIRSAPDFVPHLREGLLRDFEHFLGTLRAVHSGVDLETAVRTAGGLLDPAGQDLLHFVLRHRAEEGFPPARLAERIFEARGRIGRLLEEGREVRDLLFLDLALEATLRARVEQSLDRQSGIEGLVDLIRWTLENFAITHGTREIELCLKHWRLAARSPGAGPEWALETGALVERLSRGLAEFGAAMRGLLQPKAEFLGQAFGADAWTTRLFSEEVVRGTLASVLSILLHRIGPLLRGAADLGDWEVVSPGAGRGRLEYAATLEALQGKRYDRPAVILADRLSGYEEIPQGVEAIVTPQGVDVLSHLAIRARNARILFAVCHDRGTLDRLRALEGASVRLAVNGTGDVRFEEDEEEGEGRSARPPGPPVSLPPRFVRPLESGCAVPLDRFEEGVVGRKSLNLRRLAEQRPARISVPASVALPFGSFERALAAGPNRELARRYGVLAERAGGDSASALEELRRTVLSLEPPEGWMEALVAVMEKAGLPRPEDLEGAWTCVKRVWASMWNQRAVLSRKARGMGRGRLQMAVLIQEVVSADYGFVLHTANPVSQSRDEVYAEVVLGLGETLVGNHPGSALRMVCPKRADKPRLLSFPSKSIGLYGTGLIFRSDSSGEDLSGFAGAGLYDSFLLKPPDPVRLDYASEPLVRDKAFREELARELARVGVAIEEVFGAPQDIEGAFAGGRVHVVQSRPQVGFADA